MKQNTFYSHNLKCEVKQINVRTAKKLFENGKELYLIPSNMVFDSLWYHPMSVKKETAHTENFDHIINEFSYYNCDNERGKYIQYFVRVSDFS